MESAENYNLFVTTAIGPQCQTDPAQRVECGYYGITAQQCKADGCCWSPNNVAGAPWCFTKSSASKCSNSNNRATMRLLPWVVLTRKLEQNHSWVIPAKTPSHFRVLKVIEVKKVAMDVQIPDVQGSAAAWMRSSLFWTDWNPVLLQKLQQWSYCTVGQKFHQLSTIKQQRKVL